MSTTYPQVILIASFICHIIAFGGLFYLRNKILRDFPGRSTINTLSLEVGELAQATTALNERFTRFQKRDGMREARSAKEREQEILAQAHAIAAEGGSEEPAAGTDKLALYRRINH